MKKSLILMMFFLTFGNYLFSQTWRELRSSLGTQTWENEITVLSHEQFTRLLRQFTERYESASLSYSDALEMGAGGRVTSGTRPSFNGYYYLLIQGKNSNNDSISHPPILAYGHPNTGRMLIWFGGGDTTIGSSEYNRQYNQYMSWVNGGVGQQTQEQQQQQSTSNQNNQGTTVQSASNEFEQRIRNLTETIRLNPNYAVAYNNRGVAYYENRDYNRAIADYTQAIRIDPNYAVAYNNRGVAYYENRDYNRAIADYTQAIRIDPNDAKAYNNRGVAYYENRDYDRAIADFEAALRINPNHASRQNLEDARRARGR